MTAAIRVDSLHKSFGRREVLHGLGFTLEPGTVLGLVGPNGAGKTTTLRCLLDIIRPSSGTVEILGQNPGAAGPALRRKIGYLPGELVLASRVTGRDLLRHLAEMSGPVAPGTINTLAERLNVPLDRPVRQLSKGNKQKLGIIQAFMHTPEVLVLDEPTSGLDPLLQQEFLSMVTEARHDGRSVLLSSHVLSELQQSADRVAVLRDGRIVANSTVDELREGALRRLKIRLDTERAGTEDAAATLQRAEKELSALPNVSGIRTHGTSELEATVHHGVQELLLTLTRLPLADVVLEEPDLEEAVLKLYSPSRAEEA